MTLKVGLVATTLILGATVSGCGAGRDLKGSMRAYETGNFRSAEQRCEAIDEDAFEGKVQVRYLVYCGLAYYKVGRQDAAREFLLNGQKLYTTGDPWWLKPLIVDEMNKAILNLNGVRVAPTSYAAPNPADGKLADGDVAKAKAVRGADDYE